MIRPMRTTAGVPTIPAAPPNDDTRLQSAVGEALYRAGYQPLRSLEVHVDDGHVVLRGRVPDFYCKQLAQAAALAIAEVRSLRNELEVA